MMARVSSSQPPMTHSNDSAHVRTWLSSTGSSRPPTPPPSRTGSHDARSTSSALIARGKANRAIANELHLSERTVHRHVSNIFTKLDVDSRTAAVAYAITHRIVEMGPQTR